VYELPIWAIQSAYAARHRADLTNWTLFTYNCKQGAVQLLLDAHLLAGKEIPLELALNQYTTWALNNPKGALQNVLTVLQQDRTGLK
jgi:hypothetical protein